METVTKATKRSSLSIQVEGHNLMNQYAKKLINELIPELKKLEGQKILLSDGNKSKKFTLKPYDNENIKGTNKHISQQYWYDLGSSNWLNLKICINGGSYDDNTAYCVYFQKALWISETKNQVLTKVETIENLLTSYDLDRTFSEEDMKARIEAYKVAKTKSDKLLSAIPEQIRGSEYLNNY